MKFDLRQTNIAKGIALLMLLWHHLFFKMADRYELYGSLFRFRGVPIESWLSVFCKVCVSIFIFLSGYGIFKSYSKYTETAPITLKSDIKYVKNRLIKLLAPYWVIYIIFVPMGLLFGVKFYEIYGNNPFHYFADFFGLSYLFFENDYTVNKTWWYMSIIIVLCVAYPILHRLFKFSKETLLALCLFLLFIPFDFRELTIWLVPFVCGMYASKTDIFEKLDGILNSNLKKFLFTTIMLLVSVLVRYRFFSNRHTVDFAFAFFVVLFSFFFISKIPFISKALEEIGKKSGLIFMFHTFIYSMYLKSFIYSFKYSVFKYLVLLIICIAVAYLLDFIMNVTGYNKLIKKISK